MHALVVPSESFICALLAQSFQEMYQRKKEAVFKVFCFFFFKSFVAVTHNAVNGLDTVSSGDVKQSLLNERMLVAL